MCLEDGVDEFDDAIWGLPASFSADFLSWIGDSQSPFWIPGGEDASYDIQIITKGLKK